MNGIIKNQLPKCWAGGNLWHGGHQALFEDIKKNWSSKYYG